MTVGETHIGYWLVGDGAQAPERRLGVALDLKARLPGRGWRLVWGLARIPTGVALGKVGEASRRVAAAARKASRPNGSWSGSPCMGLRCVPGHT